MRLDHNHWDPSYGFYAGFGKFAFAAPTLQPLTFRYQCSATFSRPGVTQFQARWITPGKKLEVLLAPADNLSKARTCPLAITNREPLKTHGFVALAPNY